MNNFFNLIILEQSDNLNWDKPDIIYSEKWPSGHSNQNKNDVEVFEHICDVKIP